MLARLLMLVLFAMFLGGCDEDPPGRLPDASPPDAAPDNTTPDAGADTSADLVLPPDHASPDSPTPPGWAKTSGWTVNDVVQDSQQGAVAVGAAYNSLGFEEVVISNNDTTGAKLWSLTGTSPGSCRAHSVALDPAGNAYIAGSFYGKLTLGGETVSASVTSTRSAFVAKVSPQGSLVWLTAVNGTNAMEAWAIAVGSKGEPVFAGSFRKTATFGSTTLTAKQGRDAFVAMLSASGAPLWAKAIHGSQGHDHVRAVGLLGNGDVVLGGQIFGPTTLGTVSLAADTKGDIFLARYSAQGALQWARLFSGPNEQRLYDLALGANGEIFIAGVFREQLTMGSLKLKARGTADYLLAKLTSDGKPVWARSGGGKSWDEARGVAVDASGNSVISGSFAGVAQIGGKPITPTFPSSHDSFVVRHDSAGKVIHVWAGGGFGEEHPQAVVTSGGWAYVVGYFSSAAMFGGHKLSSEKGAVGFLWRHKMTAN